MFRARTIVRTFLVWGLALALSLLPQGRAVIASEGNAGRAAPILWHTDYHAGLEQAVSESKPALLWFDDSPTEEVESSLFSQAVIASRIQERYIAIKLPTDASIPSADRQISLLVHPAFSEMRRSAGLAIIDMSDRQSPLFRQVVSVYPFANGPISPEKLTVLLDLPRGTLTQRTLIFAVRTHPEQPASTTGHLSQLLTRETENHAWHQASIALQGHHNWDARFHAINAQLPGGLAAREVCAESWPGQNLLDAAQECVHSWRQSPGHWDAVRSRHLLFSYDMKRGPNGVWYAAGIFAGR